MAHYIFVVNVRTGQALDGEAPISAQAIRDEILSALEWEDVGIEKVTVREVWPGGNLDDAIREEEA